ncbi:hypothetical protein MTO96_035096 [Rhipicephalus appendiculatus]
MSTVETLLRCCRPLTVRTSTCALPPEPSISVVPPAQVFDPDRNACDIDRGTDVTDLALPGNADDDFTCDGRRDGLHPDETQGHDCARYYSCEGGRKRIMLCPTGTRFNPVLLLCSSSVLCHVDRHFSATQPPAPSDAPVSTTQTSTTTSAPTSTVAPTRRTTPEYTVEFNDTCTCGCNCTSVGEGKRSYGYERNYLGSILAGQLGRDASACALDYAGTRGIYKNVLIKDAYFTLAPRPWRASWLSLPVRPTARTDFTRTWPVVATSSIAATAVRRSLTTAREACYFNSKTGNCDFEGSVECSMPGDEEPSPNESA